MAIVISPRKRMWAEQGQSGSYPGILFVDAGREKLLLSSGILWTQDNVNLVLSGISGWKNTADYGQLRCSPGWPAGNRRRGPLGFRLLQVTATLWYQSPHSDLLASGSPRPGYRPHLTPRTKLYCVDHVAPMHMCVRVQPRAHTHTPLCKMPSSLSRPCPHGGHSLLLFFRKHGSQAWARHGAQHYCGTGHPHHHPGCPKSPRKATNTGHRVPEDSLLKRICIFF